MPAPFRFELVSPERLVFSGPVEAVIVPGTEGQFTVLKDHAPFMSTLKPGIVEIDEAGGKATKLFVRGGFADVSPEGLTILAEQAIPYEQLDAPRLQMEIDALTSELNGTRDDETRRVAQERLDQLNETKVSLGL